MNRDDLRGRYGDWETRFWSRVSKSDDCWTWVGGKDGKGYGVQKVDNRQWLAHRLAWLIAHNELDDDVLVLHSCDNRACVRPDHLFLGTHLDNHRDREAKGRGVRLPRASNPRTRIYPEDIPEVRRLSAKGMSQREIGQRFSVAQSTIHRALKVRS